MRLAAQIKAGYYPAHPEAVQLAIDRIVKPDHHVAILDPCCGEGAALKQLHDALGGTAYGVELDDGRAATAKELMPDGNIIGPASFLSNLGCTRGSFSFAWVNPPFDNELGGGGREELAFLRRATDLLMPGGVIAFVAPENVATKHDAKAHFWQHYEHLTCVPFPDGCRPFAEVLVMARKRGEPLEYWWSSQEDFEDHHDYTLPESDGPRRWVKIGLTEDEQIASLARSPLERMYEPEVAAALERPPMSLGKGHIALLLASGLLDGVVAPEGEEPFVVRGTCRKEQYLDRTETDASPNGETIKTTSIYAEKVVLTVRAVGRCGVVRTFE